METRIRNLAEKYHSDIISLRRAIHQNPELAFEENETAALVANKLASLPMEIHTGIAQTGVVGVLKGAKDGPTICLRADMDALPIQEQTGLPFASQNDGVMHACGHDAHTSSLLGAAKILSEIQDELRGTIRFIFQPSEERLPGGAKKMIEEGVLRSQNGETPPESIFGQHVMTEIPAGHIGVRPEMYMASSDEFYVTIKGAGGHAAMPHVLDTDPVLVASQVVVALQTLISRHCPPDVPSVLSVGNINTDGAPNVIPDQVELEGTFRAMDEEWRTKAYDLIRRIVANTAEAHGARYDCTIEKGYPALYNDPDLTDLVREAAVNYVGEKRTVDLDPWFASEDFAYYTREIPGVFYRLGVRNEEEGITHPVHTSKFDIDETALRTGAGFLAYLTWYRGRIQQS